MRRMSWGAVEFLIFLLVVLSLPSLGDAQTCTAERYDSTGTTLLSTHTTIQAAVNAAGTANIIRVTDTCSENVTVREEKARITLDPC